MCIFTIIYGIYSGQNGICKFILWKESFYIQINELEKMWKVGEILISFILSAIDGKD
jgi:hypothetical protein